jgi:hypothetical protein
VDNDSVAAAVAELHTLLLKHGNSRARSTEAVTSGIEAILRKHFGEAQADAVRWQTLEQHCRWVGICPINKSRHGVTVLSEEQHSFDPRHERHRSSMRGFVDKIKLRHEGFNG